MPLRAIAHVKEWRAGLRRHPSGPGPPPPPRAGCAPLASVAAPLQRRLANDRRRPPPTPVAAPFGTGGRRATAAASVCRAGAPWGRRPFADAEALDGTVAARGRAGTTGRCRRLGWGARTPPKKTKKRRASPTTGWLRPTQRPAAGRLVCLAPHAGGGSRRRAGVVGGRRAGAAVAPPRPPAPLGGWRVLSPS